MDENLGNRVSEAIAASKGQGPALERDRKAKELADTTRMTFLHECLTNLRSVIIPELEAVARRIEEARTVSRHDDRASDELSADVRVDEDDYFASLYLAQQKKFAILQFKGDRERNKVALSITYGSSGKDRHDEKVVWLTPKEITPSTMTRHLENFMEKVTALLEKKDQPR